MIIMKKLVKITLVLLFTTLGQICFATSFSSLNQKPSNDPYIEFKNWQKVAAQEMNLSSFENAVISTVDSNGQPHARVVFISGVTPAGFIFNAFTNQPLVAHITANNKAEIMYLWNQGKVYLQVKIDGIVSSDGKANLKTGGQQEGYNSYILKPTYFQFGLITKNDTSTDANYVHYQFTNNKWQLSTSQLNYPKVKRTN